MGTSIHAVDDRWPSSARALANGHAHKSYCMRKNFAGQNFRGIAVARENFQPQAIWPRPQAQPSFSMLHAINVFQRATLKNWVWPGDETIILHTALVGVG